jgi:hypothetical protein
VAEFSASDAAFTGFRVVAERPWTVAIWAGLQLVFALGIQLFVAYSDGPAFTKATAFTLPSATQDPAAQLELYRQVAPTSLVVVIASLILNAIVYAAMNRAVLKPDESRFGYLRLAADELRQLALFAVFVGIGIATTVALVLVTLVLTVIVGLAVGEVAAVTLEMVVLVLGLIAAFIFFAVRLSLASPMVFATRRIDILGAWRLTRGRFWALLQAYLIAFALSVVVFVLTSAIVLAAVAVVGGGVAALGSSAQSDLSSLTAVLTPARLTSIAVFAIGQALIWPVTMTPPATIYRALAGGANGARRVFD